MSEPTKTAAAAPVPAAAPTPGPEDAFNYLVQRIHAPVFFNKLASFGRAPANEAEATAMLESGAKLWAAQQVVQTKQAATSPVMEACSRLDGALSQFGLGAPVNAAYEANVKQAAVAVLQDPDIVHAVKILRAAV